MCASTHDAPTSTNDSNRRRRRAKPQRRCKAARVDFKIWARTQRANERARKRRDARPSSSSASKSTDAQVLKSIKRVLMPARALAAAAAACRDGGAAAMRRRRDGAKLASGENSARSGSDGDRTAPNRTYEQAAAALKCASDRDHANSSAARIDRSTDRCSASAPLLTLVTDRTRLVLPRRQTGRPSVKTRLVVVVVIAASKTTTDRLRQASGRRLASTVDDEIEQRAAFPSPNSRVPPPR